MAWLDLPFSGKCHANSQFAESMSNRVQCRRRDCKQSHAGAFHRKFATNERIQVGDMFQKNQLSVSPGRVL